MDTLMTPLHNATMDRHTGSATAGQIPFASMCQSLIRQSLGKYWPQPGLQPCGLLP